MKKLGYFLIIVAGIFSWYFVVDKAFAEDVSTSTSVEVLPVEVIDVGVASTSLEKTELEALTDKISDLTSLKLMDSFVLMGYEASGFGTVAVNGIYCPTELEDIQGFPVYKQVSTDYYFYYTDYSVFGLNYKTSAPTGADLPVLYYSVGNSGNDPSTIVSWFLSEGDSPGGSLTEVECETATLTVLTALGSLNFGLAILIVISLVYFIIMIWNNIKPKRKW